MAAARGYSAIILATLGKLVPPEKRSMAFGIGVAGPVDFSRGSMMTPPIMPGWDRFPIREAFAGEYAAPQGSEPANLDPRNFYRKGSPTMLGYFVTRVLGLSEGAVAAFTIPIFAACSDADPAASDTDDTTSTVAATSTEAATTATAGATASSRTSHAAILARALGPGGGGQGEVVVTTERQRRGLVAAGDALDRAASAARRSTSTTTQTPRRPSR